VTRFLFRLIGLLSLVSLLLVFATHFVGSLRPTMPLGIFMTSPDGTACDQPCLFGVYPGVTTIEQAKQLLDSHPLTHDGVWINARPLLLLSDKKSYVALGSTEDNHVDNIIFTDSPYDSGIPVPGAIVDTMQLGEIILGYGKPVVGLPGSTYVVVEYPNMGIIAAYARSSN
jgi:hypothetical protein